MICNAVLFMSFKSGFERIKLGFVQIFDHIDMPQSGEVGGKPNLGLVQGIDGGGVELFHRTHHEVLGEDIGMRAGQDGVAFLHKDVRGDVFHHAVTVVVGLPLHAGQFLALLNAHADHRLAVQQAHDGGIMAADIRDHSHDALSGDDAHVALDAVNRTFINNDVVVGLGRAVVDDLGGDVFIERVTLADVVSAGGGVIHDRQLLPEHGILFRQLFVGFVEAEIIPYLAAPLIDFAHNVVGGVHHAVAVESLAVGKQQDGNHLEQDEQDDEVMLDDETPQVIHVLIIGLRVLRQAQGPL